MVNHICECWAVKENAHFLRNCFTEIIKGALTWNQLTKNAHYMTDKAASTSQSLYNPRVLCGAPVKADFYLGKSKDAVGNDGYLKVRRRSLGATCFVCCNNAVFLDEFPPSDPGLKVWE